MEEKDLDQDCLQCYSGSTPTPLGPNKKVGPPTPAQTPVLLYSVIMPELGSFGLLCQQVLGEVTVGGGESTRIESGGGTLWSWSRGGRFLIWSSSGDRGSAGLQNTGSTGSTAPRKFHLKNGSARKFEENPGRRKTCSIKRKFE